MTQVRQRRVVHRREHASRHRALFHHSGQNKQRIVNRPYRGISDSVAWMVKLAREGQRHPAVRRWADEVVREVTPRDYISELAALYYATCAQMRYTRDPKNAEYLQHPAVLLKTRSGDCFAKGTLVLRDDYTFVPVEEVRTGERIWGKDRWSVVEDAWFSGVKPVTAIRLNNGAWFKVTEDHQVYVLQCGHKHRGEQARVACHAPASERTVERIRVAQLRAGDVVLTPARIPYGDEELDSDRAWVEGLFLADGWADGPRFNISGQDGCPKEDQKRQVEALCAAWGLKTRRHRKYLAINDKTWAMRMQEMGRGAPNKHMLSLNLTEEPAQAYLRGIMADSGANTNGVGRTLTSTSRQLVLQARMLLKMAGVRCSTAYIENHGGLGSHPIHRLGVPDPGAGHRNLKVKEIVRNVEECSTWDITTDDHYVYLPEADITVSNCDDSALFLRAVFGARGLSVGLDVQFITVGFHKGQPTAFSHVLVRVRDPKLGWIIVDPVAGPHAREMIGKVQALRGYRT